MDHAWTFQEERAKKQLRTAPNLLLRMANLTECVADEPEGNLLSCTVRASIAHLPFHCRGKAFQA